MPRKPKKSVSDKALDSVVATQMPGWRIVRTKGKPMRKTRTLDKTGTDTPSKAAPSIKELKRKFLRKSGASDSDESVEFSALDKSVKTVRVEPKDGGPALTADIKD